MAHTQAHTHSHGNSTGASLLVLEGALSLRLGGAHRLNVLAGAERGLGDIARGRLQQRVLRGQ